MPNLGVPELVLILVIVVLLFGPSRLSKIGRSLGEGLQSLRRSFRRSAPDESSVGSAEPEHEG